MTYLLALRPGSGSASSAVARGPSPDHLVEELGIEPNFAIVFASQVEQGEPVIVTDHLAVLDIVEIDQATVENKERHHWLRRVGGDIQCVGLTGGLVDVTSWSRDPVVFQVSPLATERIPVDLADVEMWV